MEVPAGWASDVEVLRLGGSVVEDRGDHLVIATPRNPGFHWGNLVLVTGTAACSQAHRWVRVFAEELPEADHVSVGLPAEPETAPWAAEGLAVESELVMTRAEPCAGAPLPEGYRVRPLAGAADWAAAVAADVAEEGGAGQGGAEEGAAFRAFAQRRATIRSELCDRGVATFLGAFGPDGQLAAQLGIVLCGALHGRLEVARYQHVVTAPMHRGRGLASHLLGAAGAWAAERGADLWEIHVDPGTAAHRLYDGLGFAPAGRTWQAHRGPTG